MPSSSNHATLKSGASSDSQGEEEGARPPYPPALIQQRSGLSCLTVSSHPVKVNFLTVKAARMQGYWWFGGNWVSELCRCDCRCLLPPFPDRHVFPHGNAKPRSLRCRKQQH